MGILIWSTGIQAILAGVTGSHLTGPFVIECGMTVAFFFFLSELLTQFTVTFGKRISSTETVSSMVSARWYTTTRWPIINRIHQSQ